MLLPLVLLIAACIVFFLAAISVPGIPSRINLVALGLFLWTLSLFVERL